MGDRTCVSITVPSEVATEAHRIIKASCNYDERITNPQTQLTHFYMFEVNYGDPGCQHDLIEAGIPFDLRWEAGDNYEAGTTYYRFNPDGSSVSRTVEDSSINPPIDSLLGLCDKPELLIQFIKTWKTTNSPLSWDNQVEYGKRHKMLQLITQS